MANLVEKTRNPAGKLHTNSEYAADISQNLVNSISDPNIKPPNYDVANLRSKEKDFYRRIFPTADNFTDFMILIRQFFSSIPAEDKEGFIRFSNDRLNTLLPKMLSAANETKIMPNRIEVSVITKTGTMGKRKSSIDFNLNGLQNLINQLASSGKIKLGTKDLNKINAGDFNETMAKRILNKAMEQGIISISFAGEDNWLGKKGETTGQFTRVWNTVLEHFPWGTTTKELGFLKEEADPEVRQQYERFYREAIVTTRKVFLDFLCAGCSSAFISAFNLTWNQKIENLMDFSFFSKGGNLQKGMRGALGEFQAAMIMNYFQIKGLAPELRSAIMGDQGVSKGTNFKEQGKVDVHLSAGNNFFGAQIKNINLYSLFYNKDTSRNYIDTNVHPEQLKQYFTDGESFLLHMANAAFNKSYYENYYMNTENILNSYFNQIIGGLFNLAMEDNIENQITDTVCFYIIDGRYFVPGSKILAAAAQQRVFTKSKGNKIPFLKNVKVKGIDDAQYGDQDYGATDENGKLFASKYWKKEPGGHWQPRNTQFSEYKNLIGKHISIQSGFAPGDPRKHFLTGTDMFSINDFPKI